eukprot:TRINITY_DN36993_c0_g1_i1.p1 TRINITY_DN36993_c0_g1~~TRINITY_DN36993_c0_g1_i1.p1  ORF type:complete len:116 (-),score=27.53 TRINITY_DN36993_c0_g1_i1:167-514(-)
MTNVGTPIKLLHESEFHIVTLETKTGEVYRGQLVEAEDNMNCQMKNITLTYKDGRKTKLEYAFIRGSKIRWIIVPDMLKNAPMFTKNVKGIQRGIGRGRGMRGRGRGFRGRGVNM